MCVCLFFGRPPAGKRDFEEHGSNSHRCGSARNFRPLVSFTCARPRCCSRAGSRLDAAPGNPHQCPARVDRICCPPSPPSGLYILPGGAYEGAQQTCATSGGFARDLAMIATPATSYGRGSWQSRLAFSGLGLSAQIPPAAAPAWPTST